MKQGPGTLVCSRCRGPKKSLRSGVCVSCLARKRQKLSRARRILNKIEESSDFSGRPTVRLLEGQLPPKPCCRCDWLEIIRNSKAFRYNRTENRDSYLVACEFDLILGDAGCAQFFPVPHGEYRGVLDREGRS